MIWCSYSYKEQLKISYNQFHHHLPENSCEVELFEDLISLEQLITLFKSYSQFELNEYDGNRSDPSQVFLEKEDR